ncbi:hypothetical protein IFR04_000565 [Cadophora malorum]|uniref:Uncharacterized protein n=1 Tax=Cadophora malorum TaxID=108018 RepID=A0A8H8BWG8_9HELO|nr:hypothetical protein IFR04_000565 [Cadophora malorum]
MVKAESEEYVSREEKERRWAGDKMRQAFLLHVKCYVPDRPRLDPISNTVAAEENLMYELEHLVAQNRLAELPRTGDLTAPIVAALGILSPTSAM